MIFKRLMPVLMILACASVSHASSQGEKLFFELCASCHTVEGPPELAPPVFGVINHVKRYYPQRKAFIERIVSWVKQPDITDVLMPGAVRRFGLMPVLPYVESDVRQIAEYLYDGRIQLPDWYAEHYRQEHGEEPGQ